MNTTPPNHALVETGWHKTPAATPTQAVTIVIDRLPPNYGPAATQKELATHDAALPASPETRDLRPETSTATRTDPGPTVTARFQRATPSPQTTPTTRTSMTHAQSSMTQNSAGARQVSPDRAACHHYSRPMTAVAAGRRAHRPSSPRARSPHAQPRSSTCRLTGNRQQATGYASASTVQHGLRHGQPADDRLHSEEIRQARHFPARVDQQPLTDQSDPHRCGNPLQVGDAFRDQAGPQLAERSERDVAVPHQCRIKPVGEQRGQVRRKGPHVFLGEFAEPTDAAGFEDLTLEQDRSVAGMPTHGQGAVRAEIGQVNELCLGEEPTQTGDPFSGVARPFHDGCATEPFAQHPEQTAVVVGRVARGPPERRAAR